MLFVKKLSLWFYNLPRQRDNLLTYKFKKKMSCIARRATKQTQPSICIAAPSASAPCSAPCVGGAFHSKRLQIRSCDDSAHTMIWDCVALYFWSEFKETETVPVQHPASPALVLQDFERRAAGCYQTMAFAGTCTASSETSPAWQNYQQWKLIQTRSAMS